MWSRFKSSYVLLSSAIWASRSLQMMRMIVNDRHNQSKYIYSINRTSLSSLSWASRFLAYSFSWFFWTVWVSYLSLSWALLRSWMSASNPRICFFWSVSCCSAYLILSFLFLISDLKPSCVFWSWAFWPSSLSRSYSRSFMVFSSLCFLSESSAIWLFSLLRSPSSCLFSSFVLRIYVYVTK